VSTTDALDSRHLARGNAQFRVASLGYFGAMAIPLIRGRLFDERDAVDAPHVALISASLAEARWPGEDPLGKLIQFGGMDGDLRPFTVVESWGTCRSSASARCRDRPSMPTTLSALDLRSSSMS